MNRKMIIGLAVLLAIPLIGYSQVTASKFRAADASCALAVKYIGTDTNLVTVAEPVITVVADGLSQTKTMGETTTVGDVGAWFEAITNATGAKLFKAVAWEALTTDIMTNKILASSASEVDKTWDMSKICWDVSDALHYDVVCDTPNANGYARGNYMLKGISGDPTGTGNVTLNVYVDDTMLYQKTFTSPVYVPTSVGTTNTAADPIVTLESADFPGIWIGAGQKGLVRATRATSATTGGVGASVSGNR